MELCKENCSILAKILADSNNSSLTSINNLDKLSKMIEIIAKEKRKTDAFSIFHFTIPDHLPRWSTSDFETRTLDEGTIKETTSSIAYPLLLVNLRFAINSVNANRCSRSARDLQTETFYVERESRRFYNREKEIKGEARFLRAFTGLFDSCWRTYARVALAS